MAITRYAVLRVRDRRSDRVDTCFESERTVNSLVIDLYRIVRPTISSSTARELCIDRPTSLEGWIDAIARLESIVPRVIRQLFLDTIAAWCIRNVDARDVLRNLYLIDHRLLVWSTCACVQRSVPYLLSEGNRSKAGDVIHTALQWVRGGASDFDCLQAYNSFVKSQSVIEPSVRAVANAIRVVFTHNESFDDVSQRAIYAIYCSARAMGDDRSIGFEDRIDTHLEAFCAIIRDAVLTLPETA